MIDITEVARTYLAIFYTFVAVFYTSRIILMKRALNKELVFPGEKYCVNWWNHIIFRVFRALIWAVCLVRWIYPEFDYYLGIIEGLYTSPVIATGLVLLTFGFVFTLLVHYKMGKIWRSGIDPYGPKELIQTGFYRYTRNPMFCFVALAQLGFFFALPSCFSATCLVIGLYTLNSQAKEEEKHLIKVYPNEYGQYANRVRRWL